MAKREIEEKSRLICGKVLKSRQYREASILYGYYPLGNEVNVLPIVRQALCVESGWLFREQAGAVRWNFIRSPPSHR